MKNYLVAVTGGIGSGKSTAVKILKDSGYTVFSADDIYRKLLKNKTFQKAVYDAAGIEKHGEKFEFSKVSEAVFNDEKKLEKLNAVTHPAIMNAMLSESKAAGGLVFNEVPLLFEGGYEKFYNEVIIVVRDENSRIESVMKRSGLTREDVIKRIKKQFDYENTENTAHTVISNDGDLIAFSEKVKTVAENIGKKL